jgi:Peptidase family M28/PDZ domain/PA domain
MDRSRHPAVLLVAALAAISTLYLNSLVPVPPRRIAAEMVSDLSAARYLDNVRYLASDQMKGRGDGTPELDRAADYIASQFRLWGLRPMGDNGTYFQSFEITTAASPGLHNDLEFNGDHLRINEDFSPILFSSSAAVDGPLMFAGYGITAPELNYDDYGNADAGGKVAVVLRQPSDGNAASHFARHASLIDKTINAKRHGAKAVIFINYLGQPEQDLLKVARTEDTSDLGIPAIYAKRDALSGVFKTAGKDIAALEKKMETDMKPVSFDVPGTHVHVATDLVRTRKTVRNVVAAVTGSDATIQNEWVVVGAHYDHLGLGDQYSLAPSQIGQIHHGADDNASGTAGVLELARLAAKNKNEWRRSVLFITFAGEELGLLGSSNFVNHPTIPIRNAMAMLNMDMIGRLNNERLFIGGVGTSPTFKPWLELMNKPIHLQLDYSDSGYGASDHTSFNAKKIPVLFFFSGLHTDYHKPSDTSDKINSKGAIQVLSLVYMMLDRTANETGRIEYSEVQQPQTPASGGGGGYGPYFGSVPDFRDDLKGVLFADVQANSPAAKAGLKQGDLLVEFDGKRIQNLYDFTYALRAKKPGDVVAVVVKRNGDDLKADVTLEARR